MSRLRSLAGVIAGALGLFCCAVGAISLLQGVALFVAAHFHAVAHYYGLDSQAFPNYAYPSGSGALLLTALVSSTLITGAWHHVNCHQAGCPRIGKHKIDGTPWCSRHQDQARAAARPSTDQLITELTAALREHTHALRASQATVTIHHPGEAGS